ncbi:MAG: Sapep family Mn(2+)-dependent dipeptidase [Oscillospiraceae bacterium]|nr:Sapep family Mn(2+)-dependent dipeptidase [Oscillospiraceae bacterium]
MNKDWTRLYADVDEWAQAHRDEFVADISRVCRIRSVSVMNKQDPEQPFGEACRKMLDEALEISASYGFETRNYDNFCGSALYGDNPANESIGIFSHFDIVPEGDLSLWTHPPFEPTLSEDGKYLFARGTADNKSCGIMGLYAMRYLKEKGIRLKNNVMLVFGLNEELNMEDMPEFLLREKCPKVSLVPDAKYPITLAEKGITESFLVSEPITGNLRDIWAGLASNAGSPTAWAVLDGVSLTEAKQALADFEKVTAEETDGGVRITAEKDQPKNRNPIGTLTSAARLTKALSQSGLVTGSGKAVIDWLAQYTDDYLGEKLGFASQEGPNGPLRCNFNLIRMADGRVRTNPDIRYPSQADMNEVIGKIKAAWEQSPFTLADFTNLESYCHDPESPTVQKLIQVACEALGQPEIEPLIDGGSYARKIPNAYAYGATVPGRVRLFGFAKGGAHQPDEYCDIPNLLLNIRVFVRALLELDELYAD